MNNFEEIIDAHAAFTMIFIKGGTFRMGSPDSDKLAIEWEKKAHDVKVRDFYLAQYPVTQDLWRTVINTSITNKQNPEPSFFRGDDRPVEQVSWEDTKTFIKLINELPNLKRPAGYSYVLPSEAQWEYAARGGHMSKGYKYAGSNKINESGWYWDGDDSHRETKPVGLLQPNELGLYDMSGNVWEWCEDYWHNNYDQATDHDLPWVDNPDGSVIGRVCRGGSWSSTSLDCRVASRNWWTPNSIYYFQGFRLCLVSNQESM